MYARRSTIPRLLAALIVAAAAGACASAGEAGEGSEGSTLLVVENNLIPSTSLSIYAVPDVGSRVRVGVVDPGQTARLRFNPFRTGGQYRFVAEPTGGSDIVSNPVSFSPGATIRWDVSANLVNVIESG